MTCFYCGTFISSEAKTCKQHTYCAVQGWTKLRYQMKELAKYDKMRKRLLDNHNLIVNFGKPPWLNKKYEYIKKCSSMD